VEDLKRDLSDHCAIKLVIKAELHEDKAGSPDVKSIPLTVKYKWDNMSNGNFYKALNMSCIQNKIKAFISKDLDGCDNIDTIVNECTDIFKSAANISLKRKNIRKLNRKKMKSKWFDRELEGLRNDIRRLSRQMCNKVPTKHDTENMRYKSKTYKSLCKRKFREYKKELLSYLSNLRSRNSKEAWDKLKELKDEDGSHSSPNNIETGDWHKHYKNLNELQGKYRVINDDYGIKLDTLKHSNEYIHSDTLNGEIMAEEIIKGIKLLKNGKAAGEDGVMNEMIKVGERPLINVLIKLFNKVLTCGIYPMEWGEGIITSIFKGGCVDETNNYRGITITSCLGKLFNSIMNCRLDSFTKENRLGCKEQIAYEKGARTTDHIFVLQTLTQKYLSENKKIFACFVDMKKAFDSVLHNAILYKLFKANINGNFFKIIETMYEKTRLSVKVSSSDRTESFPCGAGIRQGDNLSPNLF
jgi:hypothetical protein